MESKAISSRFTDELMPPWFDSADDDAPTVEPKAVPSRFVIGIVVLSLLLSPPTLSARRSGASIGAAATAIMQLTPRSTNQLLVGSAASFFF